VAVAIQPAAVYYAKTVEADGRRGTEQVVRADIKALPAMLDRVDRLLEDGTLTTEPPNAAALQILSAVRVLDAFQDLQELVRSHPCAATARELFPHYPAELPPFLDSGWLGPVRAAQQGAG
jgi:hypothetical protein